MPRRHDGPLGAPCWVDVITPTAGRPGTSTAGSSAGRAEDAPPEFGGYVNFTLDGELEAGCNDLQPGNPMPGGWTAYLAVADARAALEAAQAGGGRVMVPAMDVGQLGTMAVLTDPGGAGHRRVGAQGPPRLRPLQRAGDPALVDLETRDYEACVAFYREVFGWTTEILSDTDEFRYTMLAVGDERLAGIMDATTSCPTAPRPIGTSCSRWPTPMPRWRGWSSSAGRCWSRPPTPPTAGWPRWPTRAAHAFRLVSGD